MASRKSNPVCLVIAGPNGAGKTTFAKEFLAQEANILHFINVDLIAIGLAPLKPEMAAMRATRVFLHEIDRLTEAREDFAFESTLSGRGYLQRLKNMKAAGYIVEIVYLRLSTQELAVKRVAARVREGGHHVPADDVKRRFERSWLNFQKIYLPICDAWWVYDASVRPPLLIEKHP